MKRNPENLPVAVIGSGPSGIKSYGWAPTFLLKTGYKQVKSIVSSLVDQSEKGLLATDLVSPGVE